MTERFVRASHRSHGFTHYFSTKTVLYSRQHEHEASEYILLFDEPGIYLHPSGQNDLLHVLEALSQSSQIVYASHSIFMINRNFPTRHRLIAKTDSGTTVNTKPYSGRWGAVLSALGLSLTGPILFANQVLFCEGDSDPVLVISVFQKLIALGKLDADLNSFSAISTGESKNADALLRLLNESDTRPRIAMLFDGDKGGKERLAQLGPSIKEFEVATKLLVDGTSVEDHLIAVGTLFVDAVATYTAKLMAGAGQPAPDMESLRKQFRKSFSETHSADKVTSNVSAWAAKAAMEIGGLSSAPSKVGIAREYAMLLQDVPIENFTAPEYGRAVTLAKWVTQALGLPNRVSIERQIVE